MKKIIAMAVVAVSLIACDNTDADKTTVETGDTTSTTTTITPAPSVTTTTAYTAADGDVTYTNKKVRVWKNGNWVDADADVKLDNGVVVYKNGRVKKDNKEIEMKEGEVVNRTGNFFDKSGRAIGNAWDATKEGVKDAGKAVGNAAGKVGEKVGDVFDKDTTK